MQLVAHSTSRFVYCALQSADIFVFREIVVAGNHLFHKVEVVVADAAQSLCQFECHHVAVAFHWGLAVVELAEEFGDDGGIGEAVVKANSRTLSKREGSKIVPC